MDSKDNNHKNKRPVTQLSTVLKEIAAGMLLIGLMLPFTQAEVLAQDILWTRQFGTFTEDRAYSVTANSTGIYVAGRTLGILPDQTAVGDGDAFVRKYNADGEVIWTRQFGTVNGDVAYAVTANATGIYVAGETGGIMLGQIYAGNGDAFVCKYNADGEVIWTRQFGTGGHDAAYAVTADATGIYVAGHTGESLPGQTSAGGGMPTSASTMPRTAKWSGLASSVL